MAHVGAYQALCEPIAGTPHAASFTWDIRGVAGTSAGAIMAALVAARYTPSRIFNARKSKHLLQRLAGGRYKRPSDLFTRMGWARVAVAGYIVRHGGWFSALVGLAMVGSIAATVSPLVPGPFWLKLQMLLGFWCMFSLELAPYAKGLAPLNEVRTLVDQALADSDLEGLPEKDITFAQLAAAKGRPLKIVATNLTQKAVTVFSAADTPDVIVADAVCASICIPMLFPPYRVPMDGGDEYFIDGGSLSNLPLWTFDNERAVGEDVWTIGFSLDKCAEPPFVPLARWLSPLSPPFRYDLPAPNSLHGLMTKTADVLSARSSWLGAALDAVVAGPTQIHARQVPDLLMVKLPVWLELLDFKLPYYRYVRQVNHVAQFAHTVLEDVAIASALASLLALLRDEWVSHLEAIQSWVSPSRPVSWTPADFRMCIMSTKRRSNSLLWVGPSIGHSGLRWLRHSRAVSIEGSMPGDALRLGTAQVRVAHGASPGMEKGLMDTATGVMTGAMWTMAIPIYNDLVPTTSSEPVAVLMIDSDTLTRKDFCGMLGMQSPDIELARDEMERFFVGFSGLIKQFGVFSERLQIWH
jgi:predicted acylesterase/phospholipase RssA